MKSLSQLAGIDIQWNGDNLQFGDGLIVDETFSRPLARLKSVALDPAACTPEDRVQYWMYNGIAPAEDRDRLARTGMRYELTLMYPRAIGRERAKTLGHLHSFPAGGALNYPEVCEVLHGTALFVFQTMDTQSREAPFCAVLEAHAGDKVIIPPNLHHLTINAADEPLLFSDVIPLDVKGIYEPLAAMHGAAYLYTLDAGLIVNLAYAKVAELQRWTPDAYPSLGITPDVPLYTLFSQSPNALAWLLAPEQFAPNFPEVWKQIEAVIA